MRARERHGRDPVHGTLPRAHQREHAIHELGGLTGPGAGLHEEVGVQVPMNKSNRAIYTPGDRVRMMSGPNGQTKVTKVK